MKKLQSIKRIKINDGWIIVFIVLANIILKSIYLTDYNIDLDEPFTLYHSQQSLKELWAMFKWENNPPLYFFVLHFWIKLFGVGVLSARILPMLFGALAAGMVYKLGAKFLSKKIGLVAALIFTFSNIMIKEAHDCRVYTLLVLLTVASMYLYMSLIKERRNKKYLFALTIVNILLVYSHFLAFLVIGLQCFYLLVIPIIRKRILKQYAISIVLTFLAYLPYAAIFIFRFFETSDNGINQPPLSAVSVYATFFETFGNGFLTTNIFILLTIAFLIYILIKREKLTIYEIILTGWFFVLYLISFIVSLKFPILTTPRYLIFIVPGFFFFIVIAVNHLF
jgi:uncharacterized membrane protein